MNAAYLLIAHGSREKKFQEEFFDFLKKFRSCFPDRKIAHAFLDVSSPNITQAIEACILDGVEDIVVVPMMIFSGKHIKEDIPRLISQAKGKHSHVQFHYTGPLADSSMLVHLVDDKIMQTTKKL